MPDRKIISINIAPQVSMTLDIDFRKNRSNTRIIFPDSGQFSCSLLTLRVSQQRLYIDQNFHSVRQA